ncbi:MAG: ketoacyl-ACP synthase III [Alphaproteobacteria bacterium]|nr:ketoacyl-ACP synthase III [Alphaproteobacteria bacterium]
MIRSVITGCGAYLPKNRVTNADLEKTMETSDEWIATRTGIRARHIAAEGEFTSDLAAHAAKAAMDNAGVGPEDIDLIIVATTTPDETLPATAVHVQRKLGITQGAAFDMQAACSGFVYGLSIADSFLRAGTAKRALVIGAETFSRIVDWEDRTTCVLFGDGAGAVVVEAQETSEDIGILYSNIFSDGRYADILRTDGGVSSTRTAGLLRMAGKEVFRHAVSKMSDCVAQALATKGIDKSTVDWVIPHQANQRIMEAIADRMELPLEKIISTIALHANTSAASIPLALSVALADGRVKKGNLLALQALGAGLTWGSCLIRW